MYERPWNDLKRTCLETHTFCWVGMPPCNYYHETNQVIMRIVRGTRKDSGGGAQESLESWVSTDKKRYKHTYIKQQQLGTKVFTSVLMG